MFEGKENDKEQIVKNVSVIPELPKLINLMSSGDVGLPGLLR